MSRRSVLGFVLATLAALLCLPALAFAAAPVNTVIPGLTGEYRVGQQLTGTIGSWTPTTGVQFTQTWERCGADGTGCAVISGYSGLRYTLQTADLGKTVRIVVRATNIDGSATAYSAVSPVIGARQPPVLDPDLPPTVSGLPLEGQTLESTDGTWSGPPTIKTTRRWQRCDVAVTSCATLSATGATYKLVPADIGYVLRVQVTATNPDGATIAYSGVSGIVEGVPPANTAVPSIDGETRDGQTMKVSSLGTWTGTLPMTTAYQWERCTATGETPCTTIPDATGSSYVLGPADVDATVRVVITRTNVAGAGTAAGAASAKIGAKQPPELTAAPTITGTPMDSATLSAADGSWGGTATITTSRVWQRCDSAGSNCVDLGATASSYKPVPADVGSTIRTRVLAKNPDGSATAYSDATGIIQPAPPTLTTVPAITGAAKDGVVLSASTGAWKGTPEINYDFRWSSCTSAGNCSVIAGADQSTYRLTTNDIGTTVKVAVTAWNSAGSAEASSAQTATVTEGPPVNVDKPTISAPLVRDGEVYTATVGTWAGTGTPAYAFQWQRCSSTGTSCANIIGADKQSYTLVSADVNKTVKVVVTAFTSYGNTAASSAISPVIGPTKPAVDGSVTISGTQRDGLTLTAAHKWTGTTPMTFSFQWVRCSLSCVDITGATKESYTLTAADVGARMRVRVVASNAAGAGAADSGDNPANAVVAAQPPARTGDPTLTGTAKEGSTLTTSNGAFSGTAPIARTYEWLRCDIDGLNCAAIAGATDSSYVLVAADRALTVRARVTGTNSAGSDAATSAPSAVVGLALPVNTIAPYVSPNQGLKDGTLLAATTGTWSGSKPMDFTYQWQRCSSTGTNCASIAGAGTDAYRVTSGEVGFTVRVLVTATNGGGSTTQASLVTGIVGTNPPANDAPPTLSFGGDGVAIDGAMVYTTTGAWSGAVPMTATYEWRRCDTAGENCSTIPGATSSSYQLTPTDVGLTIRSYVIQQNSGGSNGELSAATDKVLAAPPRNLAAPSISGAAAIGRTLSASPGLWSGTPELRYDYQWLQCDVDGNACSPIAGAQASTYLVQTEDAALSLRVEIMASNAVGSDRAVSASTGEVQTQPPAEISPPTIDDPELLAQGTVLQGRPGTWGGAEPVEFRYQWRRCNVALTFCSDIPDATGQAYELVKEDVGKRVRFVLTAENLVGSATSETAPTDAVLPEPPANTTVPTIVTTGTLRDGVKLTVNNGVWTGATPMTYTVSWWRCDTSGGACIPATDVTGGTYTLTSEDVGRRMRARVIAKNAATEVSVDTAATTTIAAALPSAALRPTVVALDGKTQVGGRLRGTTGTWTGTNPMTLALQWQRCIGTTTAACDDVPGATSSEYVLREDDVGGRMRLSVTATNAGGTVVSESTPSTVVPAIPPDNAGVPSIVGGPIREGVMLTAHPGTWTGSRPLTLGYQWERCTDPGSATCPKIAGASRPTFTPTSADVGKYLRLTVIGVNAGGKATRTSVPTPAVDGIAPLSVTPPTVRAAGTIKVGGTLSSTIGKWAGTTPLTYETRWQRCDPTGVTCEDVDGGTKPLYRLTAEDVNGALLAFPMRVVVTATNSAGSTEAASALLGRPVDPGPDPGSADTTPGVARKKARDTSGRGRPGQTRATAIGKSLARVKRLRFTPKGLLLLTLTCPKTSKTTCGAFGSFGSGALRFYVDTGPIEKGGSKNVGFPISKADRLRLRGRRIVKFAMRFRAPQAKSRKMKTSNKRVAVPSKLSGKKSRKRSKKRGTAKKASSRTTTPKATGAAAAPAA